MIKFERLIRTVTTAPWYIGREHFVALLQAVPAAAGLLRNGSVVIDATIWDRLTEDQPRNVLAEASCIQGGVGVVPVQGCIGMRLMTWEKGFMTDVIELREVVANMINDPDVKGIVLHVDSPGGCVFGVADTADILHEFAQVKPIMAFTDCLMASAAYFLSAGATGIYATRDALVGSIGTYAPVLDLSELYEKLGMRIDIIANEEGIHKGAGYPGTSLTDEQRDQIQQEVQFAAAVFQGFCADHRGLSQDTMQGQCFWGEQSIGVDLIDAVASLGDVMEEVRTLAE